MSQLVRTSIGEFSLEKSVSLEDLLSQGVAGHLLPARSLVSDLPVLTVDPQQWSLLANGRVIDLAHGQAAEEFSVVDADGKLLGIVAADGPGSVRPVKSFGL
jgi:tRNA U55 pseudouridine synthase TruB